VRIPAIRGEIRDRNGIVVVRAFFKLNESNKLFQNSSLQKAAEFSGEAGRFCCLSLHRSQILEDL
jgi:hypothetical protein